MSPIRTARPYAAKAIVEHEFDTDHLNIAANAGIAYYALAYIIKL